MYEKEIQFITDYNLNKINNLGPSFTLEKLIDLDLHPAIIKYISGELDYLIYQDRRILLENSAFDYSGIKLSEYFSLIAEELKKTKKLSFEQVKKLIEKAVAFNANYAVHPLNTLTDLIFKNGEESKNVSEIKVYLNYIYYYDYLCNVLNSYFVKKKPLSFKKTDFESLIKKINDELLQHKAETIIADVIDSIADFYNYGAVSKSSVPVNFIGTYLKLANLDEHISGFNKVYKNSKKKVDIIEIKAVLFSASAGSGLREDKETGGIAKAGESFSAEEVEEKALEGETIDTTSGKNKAVLETVTEEENQADEIGEMNTAVESSEEDETDELIEEVPMVNKSKFKKDIFGFLSKKGIEKIIGTIFNDDREDFTNTMEKLEECGDYNHASKILETVFSTYKINPYNKDAVTLTDAVSDYFHQAD